MTECPTPAEIFCDFSAAGSSAFAATIAFCAYVIALPQSAGFGTVHVGVREEEESGQIIRIRRQRLFCIFNQPVIVLEFRKDSASHTK